MNRLYDLAKSCFPPIFYPLFAIKKKDINETISPIQLRHIRRYEFAKKHFKGKKILDAACGTGYGSDLLEPYSEYVGIDYADYCIKYAITNYSAEHRSFLEADIYQLNEQFQHNSFDTIISFETLEHIKYPEKALDMFFNLLKDDGILIISIPLNHPDIVYHKRKYSHEDVLHLLNSFVISKRIFYKEYFQHHLSISPLESILPSNGSGTWVGILQKLSKE
jgi:2-polyprenyl-3-methyl-5-hydroxy-6-metoxy-1,4-benzoquinol methylase